VQQLADVLDRLYVVALPMRVRFRGIMVREGALIDGPAGWGEFGAFPEYGPAEASAWLASAIEAAYQPAPAVRRDRIPINATVPAVTVDQVPDVPFQRFRVLNSSSNVSVAVADKLFGSIAITRVPSVDCSLEG